MLGRFSCAFPCGAPFSFSSSLPDSFSFPCTRLGVRRFDALSVAKNLRISRKICAQAAQDLRRVLVGRGALRIPRPLPLSCLRFHEPFEAQARASEFYRFVSGFFFFFGISSSSPQRTEGLSVFFFLCFLQSSAADGFSSRFFFFFSPPHRTSGEVDAGTGDAESDDATKNAAAAKQRPMRGVAMR